MEPPTGGCGCWATSSEGLCAATRPLRAAPSRLGAEDWPEEPCGGLAVLPEPARLPSLVLWGPSCLGSRWPVLRGHGRCPLSQALLSPGPPHRKAPPALPADWGRRVAVPRATEPGIWLCSEQRAAQGTGPQPTLHLGQGGRRLSPSQRDTGSCLAAHLTPVPALQGLKNQTQVKLNIVSCPPVTTVLIKRPDLKYQLGFSVQNGIVSLLLGPR